MQEWARRWSLAGDDAMRRADAELELDRLSAAGRSYLVAAQCYWLALSERALDAAERRRLQNAHIDAFRAAVPSLPHATTPFTLSVNNVAVAGYLFMPVGHASAITTALWPATAGATAESSYWQVAVPMMDTDVGCAAFATSAPRSAADRLSPGADSILAAVARWAGQQPGVGHLLAARRVPQPVPTGRHAADGKTR